MEYPFDMGMSLSLGAIYQYLYGLPRGELKQTLILALRQEHAYRHVQKKSKQSETRGNIEHQRFTIDTGNQIYFAHPASPRERATNEYTNGLIRQYFAKGTDFTEIHIEAIQMVQRKLNDRPRAILDYLKPDEVCNKLVVLNL